jgi:hypothetical protein
LTPKQYEFSAERMRLFEKTDTIDGKVEAAKKDLLPKYYVQAFFESIFWQYD